jgi:hypothetical protein
MFIPFQFGATAHFPPRKKGKSDIALIDIGQHPIIFSRAIGTLQPDDKLSENEMYLLECRRVCEESCPIREPAKLNITCKRLSLLEAIAKTKDCTELDAKSWSEILRCGLCKPALY